MITKPEIKGAPGCFGSALTYKESAQECRGCQYASECEPLSKERLRILRETLGINIKQPKKRIPKVKDEQIFESSNSVPKKVCSIIERLDNSGVDVLGSIRAGKNPFTDSPKFLKITSHLLLNLKAGFSRSMLEQAFIQKLGWTEGTAKAHALQAVQFMNAIGVSKEVEGKISIKDAA
jgi:hypothetical protein